MYNLRAADWLIASRLGRGAHTLCKIKWKSEKSGSFLQLSIALIAQRVECEREATQPGTWNYTCVRVLITDLLLHPVSSPFLDNHSTDTEGALMKLIALNAFSTNNTSIIYLIHNMMFSGALQLWSKNIRYMLEKKYWAMILLIQYSVARDSIWYWCPAFL